MKRIIHAEETNALYARLSADERDELLQCLLIAACQGGGSAMMRVLSELLLCLSCEDMLQLGTGDQTADPRS